ncbi:MAG: hypothetical protein KDD11_23130 [Acidobacteria bacterium]|nr:hypothetical protein [Acidobacteriota bacterium]
MIDPAQPTPMTRRRIRSSETAAPASPSGFLRLLPLWLVAVMLVVGVGLEIFVFHRLDGPPKLPLTLALMLVLAGRRR